jgi:hypothetical protein
VSKPQQFSSYAGLQTGGAGLWEQNQLIHPGFEGGNIAIGHVARALGDEGDIVVLAEVFE